MLEGPLPPVRDTINEPRTTLKSAILRTTNKDLHSPTTPRPPRDAKPARLSMRGGRCMSTARQDAVLRSCPPCRMPTARRLPTSTVAQGNVKSRIFCLPGGLCVSTRVHMETGLVRTAALSRKKRTAGSSRLQLSTPYRTRVLVISA